jgi:hypothetical protein
MKNAIKILCILVIAGGCATSKSSLLWAQKLCDDSEVDYSVFRNYEIRKRSNFLLVRNKSDSVQLVFERIVKEDTTYYEQASFNDAIISDLDLANISTMLMMFDKTNSWWVDGIVNSSREPFITLNYDAKYALIILRQPWTFSGISESFADDKLIQLSDSCILIKRKNLLP